MLRSAIIVVLASASQAIDTRCADAMTISALNPYYSAISDKCASDWDSNLPFEVSQLLAQAPSAARVASCHPDLSVDPIKLADANNKDRTEGFEEQLYSIEYPSRDDDLNQDDLVKVLDADHGFTGAESCLYLERDRQVLQAEDDTRCGIFEPGFDYTQLIGVLTLWVVAILSFAVVPLAWLLPRYYRVWRLRGSALAPSGASAWTWKTQTYPPTLVAAPRQRLSSLPRVRHRHGPRGSGRAHKGG